MPTNFSATILGQSTASFMLVLGIVIWIFIALWPARVAYRKGHSFLLFFVFSLFFFPAAVITAYVVKDRSHPVED
ncbi:MAG: hypothetical protein QG553_263 [Patescibacteria group bacterium]|nr:hypothetical protein [Patescibacteria group bacterium]